MSLSCLRELLPAALRFSELGVTCEDSTVRITDDEVVRKSHFAQMPLSLSLRLGVRWAHVGYRTPATVSPSHMSFNQ
jgi:hypothetical protein